MASPQSLCRQEIRNAGQSGASPQSRKEIIVDSSTVKLQYSAY
jgi:hypothetical protein